ncbi:MAG TPA: hypothetical protein DEP69_05955, partial [Acidimicrobiaceae bacterium]|nr:hypothetical protein [Acidimicrobiaceae bacterium]
MAGPTAGVTHVGDGAAPPDEPARRRRFVRGWVVLSGLFSVMAVTSGFAFYAQGVFLDALVDEQGFSVGIAGAGTGVFFVASGVCGYYTGGLINRFDVRWVMTVGAVVGAVGLTLLGEVREEWQLFAVMVVFGCGFALTGLVPTTTVVTRWFQRRRSVALSIASTGLSVGGIAIAPVLAAVIDSNTLVRSARSFAVVFFAAVLTALWLLVRASPESMGLRPDGDPPTAAELAGAPPAPPPGTPFARAVRSRYFVLLSIGFVLIMGAQVGAIQHIFKMTKDRLGIEMAQTALILLAATSVVARVVGGFTAMKVNLRALTTFLIVVQSGGLVMLAVADTRTEVVLGVLVLGTSMGNLLMLHPLLLADAFGVREYARVYGMGSLLMIVGVGTGPFVVGLIRDAVTYRLAFFVLAVVGIAGLTVFRAAGQPRREHLD